MLNIIHNYKIKNKWIINNKMANKDNKMISKNNKINNNLKNQVILENGWNNMINNHLH